MAKIGEPLTMERQTLISIDELMDNFRHAILSILPSLEILEVPVGEAMGYDAWEEISSTLYKHLVVEILRFGVNSQDKQFALPNYEMVYQDYGHFSLIDVLPINSANSDERFIFRCFTGVGFENVQCVILSKSTKKILGEESFKSSDVTYRFVFVRGKSEEVFEKVPLVD